MRAGVCTDPDTDNSSVVWAAVKGKSYWAVKGRGPVAKVAQVL